MPLFVNWAIAVGLFTARSERAPSVGASNSGAATAKLRCVNGYLRAAARTWLQMSTGCGVGRVTSCAAAARRARGDAPCDSSILAGRATESMTGEDNSPVDR